MDNPKPLYFQLLQMVVEISDPALHVDNTKPIYTQFLLRIMVGIFYVLKCFFFLIIHSRFLFPYFCRDPSVILTLSAYPHFALPITFLLYPTLFLLYAQMIFDDRTIYIPCAILELSGTIPELADKVGFLLCTGTIPELYRFLLCAEYI